MLTAEEVKDRGKTYKEFSKEVAVHMQVDWDDAFYQKVRSVLKGEVESPSPDLLEAFEDWRRVEENPHSFAVKARRVTELMPKLNLVERWLLTGTYKHHEAKRTIREIKRIVSE